ncbi:MAG: MerR family transcriptional regulator [Actinomycetes bacterium]
MTISELADAVGMTVRNIRAYQSRGLVHSPDIKGRVAYYSPAHIARLQLVASLQREGFTLAAIKRLVDTPHTYASIVADRRRRFRDGTSDITPTVALPEAAIREVLPDLPEDLTETGLVWREGDELVTHTLLMGVGRTLAAQGVPATLLARLQLEAAQTAQVLGRAFREHLAAVEEDHDRISDLAKVAVQLSAAAFEIAFLATVGGRTSPPA